MELHVQVRFLQNGAMEEASFQIPFENGSHPFPKNPPFDRAFYLGPDYGYSLNEVRVDVEKRSLTLGYDETIVLDEKGRAQWSRKGVELSFTLQ